LPINFFATLSGFKTLKGLKIKLKMTRACDRMTPLKNNKKEE
jgi:hypothetical protein